MNFISQLAQDYTTTTYSTTTSNVDAAAGATMALVILGITLIITLVIYALYAFLLGRIFKKAGVTQWIAWVPFYNTWKMLELGGQQGFWAILVILPVVNIVSYVFMYIAMYHIGLKLAKEGWFVILAIFIPLVWLAVLAFDSSKWDSPNQALKSI